MNIDENNKEVVLAAVKEDGYALQFASDELRDDKEVVLAAVNEDRWALRYASKSLIDDEYFLYEINQLRKIIKDGDVYCYLNENIQNNIDENPDYLLNFSPVYLKPARK
jgi:hypothetical protein